MRTDLLENLYCKGECEMTKEEYKKNLIRMFDSLRTKNKGEENCDGISCSNCPFNRKVCNTGKLIFYSFKAIEKAIEIVENWAKEHPIVTNADKFREVFGFEYDDVCDVNRFWNAEYKGKTEGCEEE